MDNWLIEKLKEAGRQIEPESLFIEEPLLEAPTVQDEVEEQRGVVIIEIL